MRLITIFTMALSLHLLYAGELKTERKDSYVEKLRPALTKILGKEWTAKLIGSSEVDEFEIAMPAIPKVEVNSRSIAVYEKVQDKIALKPEQEQKFNYVYINELYEATRQMKATPEEMGRFMNVLGQGGTREGIYRSLVLDGIYAELENRPRPVRGVAADYAVYFYGKYLGKKIEKNKIEGINIYSLKRLMTEKALEIVDAYGNDRESLEKWYGVMSADLAKSFPRIWPNKVRRINSARAHKLWAAHVPLQHIKSEIIIKIHSAMNSMI